MDHCIAYRFVLFFSPFAIWIYSQSIYNPQACNFTVNIRVVCIICVYTCKYKLNLNAQSLNKQNCISFMSPKMCPIEDETPSTGAILAKVVGSSRSTLFFGGPTYYLRNPAFPLWLFSLTPSNLSLCTTNLPLLFIFFFFFLSIIYFFSHGQILNKNFILLLYRNNV